MLHARLKQSCTKHIYLWFYCMVLDGGGYEQMKQEFYQQR